MPSIGDAVPDAPVMITTADGPGPAGSAELLGTGTVVLVGVPAAFSPVCSDFHLPGFVLAADQLKGKGVDKVAFVSVNDVFVMNAWGKAENVGEDFVMIADPDAAFTTAMGMDVDASAFGLGTRSQRYAAIIKDGVITALDQEDSFAEHGVSSAESVLAKL